MVQAQRKLVSRIEENGGKLPPQAHFLSAVTNPKQPITAKDYLSLQIYVDVHDDDLSRVDAGAQLDPEGHDAYSGIQRNHLMPTLKRSRCEQDEAGNMY